MRKLDEIENANSAFIFINLLIIRGCQCGSIGQGGPCWPGGPGGHACTLTHGKWKWEQYSVWTESTIQMVESQSITFLKNPVKSQLSSFSSHWNNLLPANRAPKPYTHGQRGKKCPPLYGPCPYGGNTFKKRSILHIPLKVDKKRPNRPIGMKNVMFSE